MGTVCAVAVTAEPSDDGDLPRRALDGRAARGGGLRAGSLALRRRRATSPGSTAPAAPGSPSTSGSSRRSRPRCARGPRRAAGSIRRSSRRSTAAGYDRSFELLDRASRRMPLDGWHAGRAHRDRPGGRTRAARAGRSRRPRRHRQGLRRHARARRPCGRPGPALTGALVDLGGDIAVWGAAPEGGPWRVDIADPRTAGRLGRNARALGRRRGDFRTRRAALRPRRPAPPPHRSRDRRFRPPPARSR